MQLTVEQSIDRMLDHENIDRALDLLARGYHIDYCKRRFAEQAAELEPLLAASAALYQLAGEAAARDDLAAPRPAPDWATLLRDIPQE